MVEKDNNARIPANNEFRMYANMLGIKYFTLANTESFDVPIKLGEEVTVKFKVVEIERTERL